MDMMLDRPGSVRSLILDWPFFQTRAMFCFNERRTDFPLEIQAYTVLNDGLFAKVVIRILKNTINSKAHRVT